MCKNYIGFWMIDKRVYDTTIIMNVSKHNEILKQSKRDYFDPMHPRSFNFII